MNEFYFVLNTQVNLCFSQIQNRRDMKPQEEKKIIKTYKGGKITEIFLIFVSRQSFNIFIYQTNLSWNELQGEY